MDPRQSRRDCNLHNLPPIITPPFQSRQSFPARGGLYHGYPGPQLRYPANPGTYFPPPPPLLKLGHQTDIPRVSSEDSIALVQQATSDVHSTFPSPPEQSSLTPSPLSSETIRASFSPFNQAYIRPLYSRSSLSSPSLRHPYPPPNPSNLTSPLIRPSYSPRSLSSFASPLIQPPYSSSCLSSPSIQPPYSPPSLSSSPYSHSPLTSHLIGLLQKPSSSSLVNPSSLELSSSSNPSPPSPGPLPLTIKDVLSPGSSGSSSSFGDKEHPVVSEESDFSSAEPSNAAKCREYRERNKQKRRREEEEYLAEYEKHKKLKAKYERQKKSIKRLKEYYLELLRKGDLMTCPKLKKGNADKEEEESTHETPPLVTVKTEIELNVKDIIVKTEDQG